MLYERWRQIAREHRHEVALHDLARGRRWTFARLAAAAEKGRVKGPVAFPQGANFIVTLLCAWRAGQVVCPLDAGQLAPVLPKMPHGCVHLKTTSATSGGPRLVGFTGAQLMADVDNIVATMGLRRDWPNLGVISLAHSYGFSNLVLPLLLRAIPLLLVEAPLPEIVRKAAASVQAVTLAGVPALWRAWYEAGAIPSNTRLAISAGAPLSLELERGIFAQCGLKVHNFYGASECGGIAYDTSELPRSAAACVGAPMKKVRLSVGRDGCLQVRSRAVGKTYWPEPDASLGKQCFRTTDLAELHGGQVYLRGRVTDQINVAGRKLSPETIERALLTHPKVRDCLVFGAPSAGHERSETIVACVAGNKSIRGETLRHFLLATLPAWQVPREWLFVKSLQVNGRGKLSRTDWRAKFLARQK